MFISSLSLILASPSAFFDLQLSIIVQKFHYEFTEFFLSKFSSFLLSNIFLFNFLNRNYFTNFVMCLIYIFCFVCRIFPYPPALSACKWYLRSDRTWFLWSVMYISIVTFLTASFDLIHLLSINLHWASSCNTLFSMLVCDRLFWFFPNPSSCHYKGKSEFSIEDL